MSKQQLFYGDNLDIMRKHIPDETVDLCYIDPPFNSKRNYNQIYNNIGKEDKAQTTAFVDTWEWNARAEKEYDEICRNENGRFTSQTSDLIRGLYRILGRGSLMSYLISMTLRINEIHRVLKSTGSFYLHCDSTANHYLRIVLDAIFCKQGGHFLNEIVWCYNVGGKSKRYFARKHDTIFWYAKNAKNYCFNLTESDRIPYMAPGLVGEEKAKCGKTPTDVWWHTIVSPNGKEKTGYPTQKPRGILDRIVKVHSERGDLLLDFFAGSGTFGESAYENERDCILIDQNIESLNVMRKRFNKYQVIWCDDVSDKTNIINKNFS